ncbi:hypothetical protein HOY80DRAFT_999657 [Tuber brumale]|nr:hypothetical protein HOY80DRAFT_999657 [Tuber brumale]
MKAGQYLVRLLKTLIVECFYNPTRQHYDIGIAATKIYKNTQKIEVKGHDGIDTLEYWTHEFTFSDNENMTYVVMENNIDTIPAGFATHHVQFVGPSVTPGLEEIGPGICTYLCRELDIFCLRSDTLCRFENTAIISIDVCEQAYSAADHNQALTIGLRNKGIPDAAGAIMLVGTFARLIQRLLELLRPTITSFKEWRIRKQDLDERMGNDAERKWLSPGGPLAPGGVLVDVVIIDDPQMLALVPLIKMARPEVEMI